MRTIDAYWIEEGTFLAVRPSVPFDNPTGCTSSTLAIVPSSSPGYKQLLAAVMQAMATKTPMSFYANGCFSAWGKTFPSFYAAGPNW
jgi:hypothetical protein